MKRLLSLLCFGLLLTTSVMAADPEVAEKPRLIDPANMDVTVDPCENFWHYANGNWLRNNEIPNEYSSWSVSHEMFERNNKILHDILEEAAAYRDAAPGSPRQKIGDFYRIAMDSVKIEEDGAKPLEVDLNFIAGLQTPDDVKNAIQTLHGKGIGVVFDIDAEADMKNPDMNITYISQGGLGLPDRDYYTREDEEAKVLREKYVQHITNLFALLGEEQAAARAQAERILALETRLAQQSLTNVELRDPSVWYNIKTVEEAGQLTPNFPWTSYLQGLGLQHVTSASMFPDKFFTEVNAMLTEVPVDDWKSYFKFHLVRTSAPYLSSGFVNENFNFYSTTLAGTKELRPRWKRVLQHTEGTLGEVLGQLYVEQTFPPRAKEKAQDLVRNLLAAMEDRIKSLDWMTEATKQKALEKLATFTPKIGYPDKWRDYSALEISANVPYLENVMRGRVFEVKRQFDKIGKPVDKTEWGMYPQTINAYYNPLANEIVFPAAILQPPSFDPDADEPSNYGAIGSVIGHEITHGFDDMGSQFGPDGSFQNWWTDADKEAFESRTKQLVTQFSNYTAIDSLNVNGELTLGENIADLGGVLVSYYALQKALADQPRQEIDGFTPEQRFFIAYASNWRSKYRPELMKLVVNTDPHSPPEFRVLGPLANIKEFQQAFNCEATDKMLRKPEEQIVIW